MTQDRIDLYLASGSPRRRELLTQIGVRFARVAVDVPEQRGPQEDPRDYVRRLALEKARAGRQAIGADVPVLGADTVGLLDDQVLEKPSDRAHARELMRAMSGRTHRVMTAVALVGKDGELAGERETLVHFRAITDDEIDRYWDTGEPLDKAGGYGIQGYGAVFVEAIEGSYSNVVGLPLETTAALLAQYNVPLWQR